MRFRGHAGWLVLVSIVVACSVYDDSLLPVAGDGGGSGGSGGGGNTAKGGSSGGGAGGSTSTGKGGSGGGGGSSGASTSKGGTTGQGGLSVYELIDDMEDGNTIVAVMGNRNGRWVTDNDETAGATTDPPKTNFPGLISDLAGPDARVGSTRAVRLRAEGFESGEWGAYVAVHFRFPDSTLYDASSYCGLHFFAKTSADSAGQVEIRMPDQYTIPAGGFCTDPVAAGGAGGGPGLCYDHHKAVLSPTPEWQEFTVYFSEMMQGNWPTYEQSPLDGLDLSAVTSIEFFMVKPAIYELWIDDLSFVNKPPGGACP
jgi:hypothetical protein